MLPQFSSLRLFAIGYQRPANFEDKSLETVFTLPFMTTVKTARSDLYIYTILASLRYLAIRMYVLCLEEATQHYDKYVSMTDGRRAL
jgi:hypothetical protein